MGKTTNLNWWTLDFWTINSPRGNFRTAFAKDDTMPGPKSQLDLSSDSLRGEVLQIYGDNEALIFTA